MSANDPEPVRPPITSSAPAAPRRAHTYSRLTTAIAVLALATAAYSLWRLDATRDRLDDMASAARSYEAERQLLRAEIRSLEERERTARSQIEARLSALTDVPKQVQELANATEELRGRAQGPERAWSRAEAMYLLDLAQRRLALNKDVETAVVALEAADARLAALRDASFANVRREIARELQLLRALRLPDTTGITARLAGLEERALELPVKGVVAAEGNAIAHEELPSSFLPRAWALLRQTFANLVRVRKVGEAGALVTEEEALLRRAHLQLMLFSARAAVMRSDAEAYRNALASSRALLGELFDLRAPQAQSMLKELQTLEPIEIDPPLPDISASGAALRRLMPRDTNASSPRGPE